MSTEVLRVDAHRPDPEAIRRAAEVLRRGGLVAFPTETVYGLGANALDAEAVHRIFVAKGRPALNPVIVHVAHADAARPLVTCWPETAQRVAERFWPGPLTLVLPRSPRVPDVVTAGGPTVALRVPRHAVAAALLQTCDLPLAAPSANRSSSISPTRGEHVLRSLGDRIDLLLDSGATPGGLESTVLDLSTETPRLLRPGLVSLAELEAVLGPVALGPTPNEDRPLPSPGMLPRHYAPHTPLEAAADSGSERVEQLRRQGARVGWVTLGPQSSSGDVLVRELPVDPAGYAAGLYAVLHELDDAGLDRIVVAAPPRDEAWRAIHDRLARAATP